MTPSVIMPDFCGTSSMRINSASKAIYMITVTKQAKDELIRITRARGLTEDKYLRLATPPIWTGEGGWGIVISDKESNDYAVKHKGKSVLLIEESVAEGMSTAILDFKQEVHDSRFTLDVY